MTITDLEFIQSFIRMANDGFALGWHERNGGNLSYRMTSEDVVVAKPFFKDHHPSVPIGIAIPNLAGEYFLVTGSGKFFRNISIAPEDNICIIEIDGKGENYRIVWGLKNGGTPTSELPSHLLNHGVKKESSHGGLRVIYHAHPTNIIAMTFLLPLDDRTFSRILWTMATECPVVFPDGVGIVPWMVPGGREIGIATAELMEKYNVAIWAHHGMFCAGIDFDTTFGLMHTVEKSAEIYFKVISAGKVRQTITDQNLRDLAKAFHVNLREEFLD